MSTTKEQITVRATNGSSKSRPRPLRSDPSSTPRWRPTRPLCSAIYRPDPASCGKNCRRCRSAFLKPKEEKS